MSDKHEPVTAVGGSDFLTGEPGDGTPPKVAQTTWAEREPGLTAGKRLSVEGGPHGLLTIRVPFRTADEVERFQSQIDAHAEAWKIPAPKALKVRVCDLRVLSLLQGFYGTVEVG